MYCTNELLIPDEKQGVNLHPPTRRESANGCSKWKRLLEMNEGHSSVSSGISTLFSAAITSFHRNLLVQPLFRFVLCKLNPSESTRFVFCTRKRFCFLRFFSLWRYIDLPKSLQVIRTTRFFYYYLCYCLRQWYF